MSSMPTTRMPLPRPRGPLSELVIDALTDRPVDWAQLVATGKMVATGGVVRDEDAQLSLLMLYELHYRGIAGVSDPWEWHPDLLAVRAVPSGRSATPSNALLRAGGCYISEYWPAGTSPGF